jgi:hypothetical protein
MSKCNCNASTGICGCITRGTGRLSFDGYWELPCPHGNDMQQYIPTPEAPYLAQAKQIAKWYNELSEVERRIDLEE